MARFAKADIGQVFAAVRSEILRVFREPAPPVQPVSVTRIIKVYADWAAYIIALIIQKKVSKMN